MSEIEQNDRSILIISGSARCDSNTRKAVDLVFQDSTNLTICDLNDFNIQPYAYETEPQDDFLKLAHLMLSHEKIVFATPVYWYAMSGVMKTFFDRLTDLISRHKKLGRSLAGKHTFFVATGTDQQLPLGFEVPFARTSEYFAMKFAGGVYFVCEGDTIVGRSEVASTNK